jgi:anti-anti-sigma factor
MRINSTVTDGVAFMVVTGEVDLACADELRAAGEAALTPIVGTLRIDLSGVTFLDSTGLSALIMIRNKADDAHVWLVLDDPQPQVRRILEITGLHKVFAIDPVSQRLSSAPPSGR